MINVISSDLTKVRNMILDMKISILSAMDDPGCDADKANSVYDLLNDAYDALCDATGIVDGN